MDELNLVIVGLVWSLKSLAAPGDPCLSISRASARVSLPRGESRLSILFLTQLLHNEASVNHTIDGSRTVTIVMPLENLT